MQSIQELQDKLSSLYGEMSAPTNEQRAQLNSIFKYSNTKRAMIGGETGIRLCTIEGANKLVVVVANFEGATDLGGGKSSTTWDYEMVRVFDGAATKQAIEFFDDIVETTRALHEIEAFGWSDTQIDAAALAADSTW